MLCHEALRLGTAAYESYIYGPVMHNAVVRVYTGVTLMLALDQGTAIARGLKWASVCVCVKHF